MSTVSEGKLTNLGNRIVYNIPEMSFKFGKDLLCNFRLNDPKALRLHCEIHMGIFGRVQVSNYSDDDSVRVNGKVVTRTCTLRPGDLFKVFDYEFLWNYTSLLDISKILDEVNDYHTEPIKMRACYSEPGRMKKEIRLNRNTTVFVLKPIRLRIRSCPDAYDSTIVAEDTQKSCTTVNKDLNHLEESPLASTLISPKINMPRESINLIDLRTPGGTPVARKTPTQRTTSEEKLPQRSLSMSLTDTPGKISEPRIPLNNLSNVSGIKKVFGKQANTPNLRGVRELMKTPRNNKNDLRKGEGVKDLFLTNVPVQNDLTDVRKLFRTSGKEKHDALEEFPGVKNLLKSPNFNYDLTNVVGVQELLPTPNDANKLEDLVGVRELISTPLEDTSVNYIGVRNLMREIPDEDSVRFAGIKELLSTSKQDVSVNYRGVRDLLREPKEDDASIKLSGVKELMKKSSAESSIKLSGVKELFIEPKPSDTTQNLSDLKDLYVIPEESEVRDSLQNISESRNGTPSSSDVVEIDLDPTLDELYDSLKEHTSTPLNKHTYSRKERPKKTEKESDKEAKQDSPRKTDENVQEWLDSIVLSTIDDHHSQRAKNTLQVPSDKYSNVTPNDTVNLIQDNPDRSDEPATDDGEILEINVNVKITLAHSRESGTLEIPIINIEPATSSSARALRPRRQNANYSASSSGTSRKKVPSEEKVEEILEIPENQAISPTSQRTRKLTVKVAVVMGSPRRLRLNIKIAETATKVYNININLAE